MVMEPLANAYAQGCSYLSQGYSSASQAYNTQVAPLLSSAWSSLESGSDASRISLLDFVKQHPEIDNVINGIAMQDTYGVTGSVTAALSGFLALNTIVSVADRKWTKGIVIGSATALTCVAAEIFRNDFKMQLGAMAAGFIAGVALRKI